MMNIFRTLCVLGAGVLALTSCLSDDDDKVTYYPDAAITQVTLGTLNKYTAQVSSHTGNDTIIKSTVTGSNYPLTIDQLNHTIYNQTALPVGTDVKHVILTTLTAKNNGVVAIKSMTSDSLTWVSTKDSIDFTQPRVLRVFSTDGTATRDYTMTLNVSTTQGTTFAWTLVRSNVYATDFSTKHLVAFADSVVLVDRGIITRDNRAYRIGTEGIVETSADLDHWEIADGVTYTQPQLKQLLGAGTNELFALGQDGGLKVCSDQYGIEWTDETLDTPATLLPTDNIAMVSWPFAPVDNADYVLMAGNSPVDETKTVVWRKISQYGGSTMGGQWVYMPVDDNNPYALARQDGLTMAVYDDLVLAVGSNKAMVQSADQGITWKTAADYALPETLTGGLVSMATDAQGRLWIATESGELWMGGKK